MVRELVERGVSEATGAATSAGKMWPRSLCPRPSKRHRRPIDRLELDAKKTLNAAAVIGSRFTPELLATVGDRPVLDELLEAQLIDQVRLSPSRFSPSVIRLFAPWPTDHSSSRIAPSHTGGSPPPSNARPDSADQNAALIAEHLEAAGRWKSRMARICGGSWSRPPT